MSWARGGPAGPPRPARPCWSQKAGPGALSNELPALALGSNLAPPRPSDRSACTLAEAQATPRALRRRLVSILIGAVGNAWAPVVAVAAEPDPLHGVTLEYEGPAQCTSRDEVLTKLRRALGGSSDPLPVAHASIVVAGETPHLVLTYRAQRGEVESRRTLVLDSCDAATEASVLLLLLTLDPVLAETLGASQVVEQAGAPEPAREPEPEPTPVPPASAESPPAPRPEPAKPAVTTEAANPPAQAEEQPPIESGWLAAGGYFVSGIAPRVGFGAALEGGVRWGPLRLGLGGGWIRSMNAALDEIPDAELSATLLRAHLTAGLEFGPRVFRFGPAVALGVEYLEIEPRGVSAGRSGATPLLSASGGAWGSLAVSEDWGVLIRGNALVPLERPRFWVGGLHSPVHRPAAVGADVFLGFFWALGSQS